LPLLYFLFAAFLPKSSEMGWFCGGRAGKMIEDHFFAIDKSDNWSTEPRSRSEHLKPTGGLKYEEENSLAYVTAIVGGFHWHTVC
jgi:hypothetical protein